MERQKTSHSVWKTFAYAVVFVIALLAIYATAYYSLVTPDSGISPLYESRFNDYVLYPVALPAPVPVYRFGGASAVGFFGTMHEIDKKIRPELWRSQSELR